MFPTKLTSPYARTRTHMRARARIMREAKSWEQREQARKSLIWKGFRVPNDGNRLGNLGTTPEPEGDDQAGPFHI
jgi:hypothetical protein